MRVRLRWTDQNTVPHSTKIYRSDTQPTSDPTGEPLVTLTNGETVWDDTTVIKGKTYWYTFVVTNGIYTAPSVPVEVTALPRTGPGAQELIWGDQDWGVYGVLDETAFITNAKLHLALHKTGGSVNSTTNTWSKMIRNGKTLFVPRFAVSNGTTWNNLYSQGLVFGVEGPGPQNGGLPDKDQKTTIMIGGDEYLVRIPTGFDDTNNPTRVTPAGLTANNAGEFRKNSDLADLIWAGISLFYPTRTKAMNGYSLWHSPSALGVYTGKVGCLPLIQEIDPAAKTMMLPNAFTSNSDLTPFNGSTAWGLSTGGTNAGWWPILELIETLEVVL